MVVAGMIADLSAGLLGTDTSATDIGLHGGGVSGSIGTRGGSGNSVALATLASFFGHAFGRDTVIKFSYDDILESFSEIDSDSSHTITPHELSLWLRVQAWHRLDDRAKRQSVGDALSLACVSI